MVRVDVQFVVDENGVLIVHAKERFTSIEASIEVVPSYGLTDDEVARMVDESFRHARADFEAHQRIDLENECRTMLDATRKILAQGTHGVDAAGLAAVEAAAAEVQRQLAAPGPAKPLKAAYDQFVAATVPLAGNVMSEVATQSIAGRTVAQVLEAKTPAQAPGSSVATAAAAPSASAPQISAPPAAQFVTIHRDRAIEVAPQPDEKECGDLGGGFRAAPAPRQEKRAMKLDWKDVEEIGIQLQQKLKGVDPLTVRFTDLHRHVLALEGFAGDPKKSNEKILESIQMAWLDEYQAERG
jgi:FeS assembly protein IscX